MFFVPLTFFLWLFYRENKVKLYKINVKGAEANINDENSDETVLDRDIKELVYLLDNSKTTVVVFEDLDRYDNIEVFTKLRELNFLLNHFIKVNGDERIVRFVYMLRDGLFFSKNRTKFFDFILPIVPIVDSKTSENKLIELLKDIENRPSGSVIANISLYVDDMRLLKSIVNEYIVYSKIVPLNKINLEADKLFALIILKNIFPNEFDLLQEDKGFIVEVFDEVDRYRCVLIKQFQKQISDIIQKIRILKSSIVADKYEAMALCIPSDVSLNYDQGKTWPKLLKEWNENPDISFSIKYSSNTEIFTYEKFVERFILINNDTSSLIKLLSDSKRIELNRLNDEKIKLEAQMKNVKIDNYRQLILKMNAEEIE